MVSTQRIESLIGSLSESVDNARLDAERNVEGQERTIRDELSGLQSIYEDSTRLLAAILTE